MRSGCRADSGAFCNAVSKSALMSSMCSMPTDTRMRSFDTPEAVVRWRPSVDASSKPDGSRVSWRLPRSRDVTPALRSRHVLEFGIAGGARDAIALVKQSAAERAIRTLGRTDLRIALLPRIPCGSAVATDPLA